MKGLLNWGKVAAFVLLASGCASNPPRESTCGRIQTESAWGFCISGPVSGGDLLYYLHGGSGSEHSWSAKDMYARPIEHEWLDSGYPAPTVISISLGPLWLLNPERAEEVVEKVIPAIEAKFGTAPRHRYLLGESMGGFNAIQLVMRHPSTFDKAAVLCPGVFRISPTANPAEIAALIARTGADRTRVETALQFWRSEFPTERTWAEVAPLIAGERLLGPHTPPLYISCGSKDEFGFFEGAKAFSELAQAKGISTQWEAVSGGHCSVEPRSVARFFAKK